MSRTTRKIYASVNEGVKRQLAKLAKINQNSEAAEIRRAVTHWVTKNADLLDSYGEQASNTKDRELYEQHRQDNTNADPVSTESEATE